MFILPRYTVGSGLFAFLVSKKGTEVVIKMTVSWVGDVYVGAETGLVKSVQLHNQSWLNLGGKPSEAKRENEILRMCWANQEESQMLLALRSGDVFQGRTSTGEICTLKCELTDWRRDRNRAETIAVLLRGCCTMVQNQGFGSGKALPIWWVG